MTDELYSRLSKAFLEGAESEYMPGILEMCLSKEEASLLLHLPGTLEEVAAKVEMNMDDVSSVFDGLFETGFVVRKQIDGGFYYGLIGDLFSSVLPDSRLFDRLETPDLREHFLDLWNRCFEADLVHSSELTSSDNPQVRIIPVEKTISMKWGEILPLESASSIFEDAKTIALSECACRIMARKCDAPTDVCVLLGDFAELFIERGVARRISKEEALSVLERCEELGLIHQLNNTGPEGYQFLCNCCSCCCTILRGKILLGKDGLSLKSRYLSSVNHDDCDGCGICIDRCQFSALELRDSKAIVDREKCFGCGLCVSACPNEAIQLIQIRDPEHIRENLLESTEDVIDDLMIGRD